MVSERKPNVKRLTSNQQTFIEHHWKSPPISSISSIASFREKKFKKKSTGHSSFASDRAFAGHSSFSGDRACSVTAYKQKLATHKSHGRKKKSTVDRKRLSRRKPGAMYAKKGRSDPPLVLSSSYTASKQCNHHSPRAFSLLTLQEYLHERSHIAGSTPYDINSVEECEMYMESSHSLHPLNHKSSDAGMPFLPSELPRSYTRKPHRNALADYCANGSVSQYKCMKASCKHESEGEFQSSVLEDENSGDDDEVINEALSVEGHHHGCVPWHNLASLTPKYNKKQIIMELAGRSFACGGFPISKRLNRTRASFKSCIAPIARPSTTRGDTHWDSLSSDLGSECAPLLSDRESKVYNNPSRIRCYPSCNSLPRIMRRKMQPADDESADANMHSTHVNKSGHAKANGCGGMRRRNSQRNNTTSRKKGSSSRANTSEININSPQSVKSRDKICGSRKKFLAESHEKHQSLSEKYRPRKFEEMVGQGMVTQALANAVLKRKIAPVYLFQGPRGTGKTCAAKIFAASANCSPKDKDVNKTTRPCGCCRHCESIYSGKSSNVVREVDASRNNGIEDMRSLLRFLSTGPQHSKAHKVLIIDECHMLTREAWNLFFNILEEPPLSVVFVLITTDMEHLPRMVLSKCQKFPFTKIKDTDILSRLQRICDMEHIDITMDALQLIASRSDGSLYDAETTLDQLTNLGLRITSGVVRELVGLVAEEKLVELLERAMTGESVKTVQSIRELMQAGIEPLALMSQLATLITDLLAGNFNPITTTSTSSPYSSARPFTSQPLGKVELEKLRQALKILSEAEKQLRSCNNKTTWLTAALLQFSPSDTLFDHHPHILEASQSSSLAGTSLTQSPIALLDTSEKETADVLGSAAATDNLNARPPWDRSKNWQVIVDEDDNEEAVGVIQERGTLYTSSMENLENCNAKKQMNLYGENREMSAANDASMSSYDAYRFDLPQEPRRDAGHSCYENSSGNKNSSQATPSSMDDIWRKVLEGSILREILSGQGKLLSLCVSEADAVAHLEFRRVEDKRRAEKAKSSISKAFQMALGCPVKVKLSLTSSKIEDLKGNMKSNKGGANTGVLEKGQINQKYRRRKTKMRSKRACCNDGSAYYSKHQDFSNSSISHRCSGNCSLTDGPYVNARVSSSDESFTNWTHVSKSDMSPSCYMTGLRNINTRIPKAKTYSRVNHSMDALSYERDNVFASSASHLNQYVVEECDDDVAHTNSQDLLYGASLRVERPDSPGFTSESFNEYVREYDRNTMTPAFNTGFLCWKGISRNNKHEAKVRHHRARRRRKVAPPLLGCVSCAHAS